ncbi:MAG: helix-turn-helix domain-containing protein [Clostridia bacterium]
MNLLLEFDHFGIRLHDFKPCETDELHDHPDCYQVSIPLSGVFSMQCNQTIRRMDARHSLIVTPHDEHRHMVDDTPGRLLLIGLKETLVQQVHAERMEHQKRANELAIRHWSEGANDRFREWGEHVMLRSLQAPLEPLEIQQIEWELANLALSVFDGEQLATWHGSIPKAHHPALQRTLEFIHEEHEERLTLDEMAKTAGISKFHLIELFRDQLGCTPARYVTRLRLNRSAILLKHSDTEITELAYQVGFGSISSFQRAFKAEYRMSPGEYRKKCKR